MLRFETQPKRNHQPRLPVNRKAVTFDPEVKSLLAELLASELELWKLGTFWTKKPQKKTSRNGFWKPPNLGGLKEVFLELYLFGFVGGCGLWLLLMLFFWGGVEVCVSVKCQTGV